VGSGALTSSLNLAKGVEEEKTSIADSKALINNDASQSDQIPPQAILPNEASVVSLTEKQEGKEKTQEIE
jgi:hypothetical protein